MEQNRSPITFALLGLATILWGSIVFLFAVTIGANLFRDGMSSIANMPLSFYVITPIWIGVPFVGFMLSLLLFILCVWRGVRSRDTSFAIALFAVALPWTLLQWVGLGAG